MENILKLIEIGIIIVIICGVILALIYPILFEIKFEEIHNQKGISYFWTVLQLIGIVGIYTYMEDTSSDGFSQAVGLTVIIFMIALIRNYKRIKKLGVDKSGCWLAVVAQAISPFCIIFVLIMISCIINRTNKKSDKRE